MSEWLFIVLGKPSLFTMFKPAAMERCAHLMIHRKNLTAVCRATLCYLGH